MGNQAGARFPARSADALPAALYGHFTHTEIGMLIHPPELGNPLEIEVFPLCPGGKQDSPRYLVLAPPDNRTSRRHNRTMLHPTASAPAPAPSISGAPSGAWVDDVTEGTDADADAPKVKAGSSEKLRSIAERTFSWSSLKSHSGGVLAGAAAWAEMIGNVAVPVAAAVALATATAAVAAAVPAWRGCLPSPLSAQLFSWT